MVVFILISDIDKNAKSWHEWIPYNSEKKYTTDFVEQLKKMGKVIIPQPNFVNFRKYAKYDKNKGYGENIYFKMEDMDFENHAEWVYSQIDEEDRKEMIVIGFEQGCHHAKYFASKYHDVCRGLFILGNRKMSKKNYEKIQNESYFDSLKKYFGDDWKDYTIGRMNDKLLKNVLDKVHKNDDYVMFLNGFVKVYMRSQYAKVEKSLVPAFIYSYTDKSDTEKLELDRKFKKKSTAPVFFYYLDDDAPYFMYGNYKDDILSKIKCFLSTNQVGGTYDQSIKIKKKIGEGVMGTVYLAKSNGNEYIYKIEKLDDHNEGTKSTYVRQIDFDENVASRYPERFMTLKQYGVILDCDHKQKINKKANKKNKENDCVYLLYKPLLDGTLGKFMDKNKSNKQYLSMIYSLVKSIQIMRKEGYSHRDLHDGNIMYKKTNSQNIKKELFLTYRGMLRIMFSSRSGTPHKFIDWATETLFIAQMGTKKQKTELSSKLMGTSVRVLKEVLNKSATSFPAVYLFTLGKVGDLRKSYDIPDKYTDDAILCKYGLTDDLARRSSEHVRKNKKIDKGTDIRLKYYSFIDPKYLYEAETDIKNMFGPMNLKFYHKYHKELAIIEPKMFSFVEKLYKQMSYAYEGRASDLAIKIN